ncbi:MAG: HPF/RaiA family ribosome-associated protein [Pirellulales bacterium]
MRLQIVDRGRELDQEQREQAERRLRYALTRFEPQVERVTLHVQDENGPKGGVDKTCRVDVYLRHGDPVTVSDADASLLAAVSRAAERVSRAVDRRIRRDQPPKTKTSMAG